MCNEMQLHFSNAEFPLKKEWQIRSSTSGQYGVLSLLGESAIDGQAPEEPGSHFFSPEAGHPGKVTKTLHRYERWAKHRFMLKIRIYCTRIL